ncbi:hypothetical protein FOG50_03792 [Hanseniaspora uvarum]|nr:hypothetical protein FOG50_03792 [Hanseniaspora uvarum]
MSEQSGLVESVIADDHRSTERPIMNAALLRLKLLNLLKKLNSNPKQSVDEAFEVELLPFINSVLTEIEKTNSFEIMSVLKLLLNFSIHVNNSLAVINKIIQYFIIEKKHDKLELDINQQNAQGNTPLHLASYLNRFDVCNLLLTDYKGIINDTIVNNNNLQALELTNNFKLYGLMVDLRNEYIKEIAHELRLAFNNRDFEHLESVLIENPRNKELLDLDGIDPTTGDTVLIEFIKKGDIVMCDWILKVGNADPFARNDIGRLPKDYIQELVQFGMIKTSKVPVDNHNSVNTNQAIGRELLKILGNAAKNQTMLNVIQTSNFEGSTKSESDKAINKEDDKNEKNGPQEITEPPIVQGYLKKWTNFATGYKLRYFILNPKEGKLSYYKNKKDLWNCRGSLDLRYCFVYLNCSEGLKFEIATQNTYAVKDDEGPTSVSDLSDPKMNADSLSGGDVNAGITTWHLKGDHPAETNKWVWCIQGAIRYCKDKNLESSKKTTLLKTPSIANTRKLSKGEASDNNEELANLSVNSDVKIKTPQKSSSKKAGMPTFNRKMLSALNENPMKSMSSDDDYDEHDYEDEDYMSDYDNDSKTSEPEDSSNTSLEVLDFEDELDEKILLKLQNKWSQLDNSIGLEITNLIELFQNLNMDESNKTILETLKSVKISQQKLNSQHFKMVDKHEKIVNKLNKILKLWIQSVKELEFELISKDDKIEELQKELKSLRRINQEKSQQTISDQNGEKNASGLVDKGHIAVTGETLKNETSTNEGLDELSSDDEFYDFEEPEEPEEPEEQNTKQEMVVLPKDADALNVDTQLKQKVSDLIDKYNSQTQTEAAKIKKNVIDLYNNSELERFLTILTDDSFEGYQDGPRMKLSLSADERPKISLWSVLKSMIGKDMTKMSLPVTFNEPTSLLQRVVEDMEYVDILNKASTFYQSSTLRMLYVAIFSVSPYASTTGRIAKPFNPLLGETYEFVEPWKNYRCVCEQVSHHPPIGAIYMDSPTWEYYGESNVDGNFNGRCFDFKHLGKWFINLKYGLEENEELYSFKKPNNQVIGILTGNPQVDNYGEMVLQNHSNGDKCVITFKARGWRSNHAYEVKGEVFNGKGEKEWVFGGHWNSEIFAMRCTTAKSAQDDKELINSANIKNTEVKFDGSKFLVWKVNERPNSPFNLTQFAIQLNALPPNLPSHLPITDTRLRPDQKCMEDGLYDKASSEKNRVEEKQRAARKKRAAENVKWEPSWFKKDKHPVTKDEYWRFTEEYWQRRKTANWDNKCPDIF